EVEHAAQAALALVALDDLGLDPARPGDRALELNAVPAGEPDRRARDRVEQRAIAQDPALEHLVRAALPLARGQRLEEGRIGDHGARLVERPEQVLGARVVDADLAADR